MPDHTDLIARLKALYPSENHAPTVYEAIAALAASRPEPAAAPDVAALIERKHKLARSPAWQPSDEAGHAVRDWMDEAAAALLAQQQRIAELMESVKEWACDACSTIYPGPPQAGFSCVICPKCSGRTMPYETLKLRRAEQALAAARRVPRECAECGATLVCSYDRKHDAAAGAEDTNG